MKENTGAIIVLVNSTLILVASQVHYTLEVHRGAAFL